MVTEIANTHSREVGREGQKKRESGGDFLQRHFSNPVKDVFIKTITRPYTNIKL